MIKAKRWGAYLLSGVVLGCSVFDSNEAYSQSVTGSTSSAQGYNPTAMPVPPSAVALSNNPFGDISFNQCVMQAQAMASASNSNMQILTQIDANNAVATGINALGGALGGAVAAGFTGGNAGVGALQGGTGLACNGNVDESLNPSTNTCDSYKVNGSFSNSSLQAALAQLIQQQQLSYCKAAEGVKAAAILDCYSQEFSNLKKAMAATKADFDSNLRAMGEYESSVKSEVEKEKRKQQTLDGKIKSLASTKAEVEGLLSKVNGSMGSASQPNNGTLAGLRLNLNQQKDLIKKFEIDKKAKRATYASDCFRNYGASGSEIRNCPAADGALLNPKDCILSIYRDQVALGLSGGSSKFTPADKKKAEFSASIFKNRLDQMLGDFGVNRVANYDDFNKRYGAELQRYGNAGNQVLREINKCDEEGVHQIEEDLKNPQSGLGSQANALRESAGKLSSDIGVMVGELDTGIRNAGKEVFGQELNELVDGAGCIQSTPASNDGQVDFQPNALNTQLKCAQGLAANLQAMLNGTKPPSAKAPLEVPLNVPGQDGSPARCKGLRDCLDKAQKLQAQSVTRQGSLEGEGTFTDSRCPAGCPGLKNFYKKSNDNLRQAAQMTADLFKKRVATSQLQMSQIKQLLGGLNVQLPQKTPKASSLNDFCPKSDAQLCEMPADFGDRIAGVAGLPDYGPEDFDGPRKAAMDKQQRYVELGGKFRQKISELTTLKGSCERDEKGQKLAKKLGKIQRTASTAGLECEEDAERGESNPVGLLSDKLIPLSRDLGDACEGVASSDNEDCSNLSEEFRRVKKSCRSVIASRDKAAKDECNSESMRAGAGGPAQAAYNECMRRYKNSRAGGDESRSL